MPFAVMIVGGHGGVQGGSGGSGGIDDGKYERGMAMMPVKQMMLVLIRGIGRDGGDDVWRGSNT